MPWPFFIAIDFESMDKYAIFREDSIYIKFVEEVIKPKTSEALALDYEMDPGKDVVFLKTESALIPRGDRPRSCGCPRTVGRCD